MAETQGGASARASTVRRRRLLQLAATTALATGFIAAGPGAEARTTQIQILKRAIAFGGYSFAGVGQYEVITGIATGKIDPTDPHNAVITDIELAPRDGRGRVTYQHNFYILKPVDLSKGNQKMMYEPPNRGRFTFGTLNKTSGGNDPATTITDRKELKNSYFWSQGYITVFSGWENGLGPLDGSVPTAQLPILHGPGGTTITGPAYEYIVTGNPTFGLTYPAASGNKARAKLTHRVHLDDPPDEVPPSGWAYTDATNTAIMLTTGNFVANDIYEFSYTAKDPIPHALGLAAIRDFNSFLRNQSADDKGNPNPIFGHVTRIYTEVSSQPGRLLNDFVHLGFNEDENGNKVFDGNFQWIAAGDGLNLNYRWSQTKRTNRNRQDLLYLEGLFPFANQTTHDPISGQTDGRYKRCTKTNTCPLAIEFYSANELWVKAGSLLTTDPTGSFDLPDHPLARNYLLSSKQHGGAGDPTSKGSCQQFLNPLDSAQVQRALFTALDEWSTLGIQPPASEVPRLDNGTLVSPDQASVGFPNIVGPNGPVTYTGLKTTRYRFDYGRGFYRTGVPRINPPNITPPYEDNPANGPIYPSYVPKTDSDGNDIAGIRLPELVVPLATYTGWGLRGGVWANDGCESSGQYIPFWKTHAEQVAAGDSRPSVEDRYASFDEYENKVVNAIDDLVQRRFLLCSDTAEVLAARLQEGIDAGLVPAGRLTKQVPSCRR